MSPKLKIRILEDDVTLGKTLKLCLELAGYECEHFETATNLISPVLDEVDIYLLDYNIHGKTVGLDIAKELRFRGSKSLIIMLTSEAEEAFILECFREAQVDDYLPKPYRIEELKARIERHLSKNKTNTKNIIVHKELKIDLKQKKVFLSETELTLTPSEYKILLFLLQNRGQIISRHALITYINECSIVVGSRCVDTHINSIRKKVPSSVLQISAKRGFGYGII